MGTWTPGAGPTSGDDAFIGDASAETADGGAGRDMLRGGGGADTLIGGEGDDTFEIFAGDFASGESLSGGAGIDTLRTRGLEIDYRVGAFTGIERIQFQQANGEARLNAIFSGAQLSGFASNLVLSGSPAQDSVQIIASSGATINTMGWTFDYPAWGLDDYIVYSGDTGNETFYGFAGMDIFFGSGGQDVFDGGGAFDFAAYLFSLEAVTADLTRAESPQEINLTQGYDTFVSIEGLAGSQFGDMLRGNEAANILLGLHGDDTLIGGGGDDDIRGGEHADRIDGGMGADILWGGADVMSGPDGIDTFVYRSPEEGGDIIRDFVARQDRLEISAAGFRGDLVPGFTVTLTVGVNPVPIGVGSQFLYDTATGRVIWEVDGAGPLAPVLIATLANRPNLSAVDFRVTDVPLGGPEPAVQPELSLADDLPHTPLDVWHFGPDALQIV